MSNEQLLATFLAIAIGAIVVYWIAYQTGRLHGYHRGLEKGTKLASHAQHQKGMTDGYVMALLHTPGQRTEYRNNVLLKTGAITPGDIEADRRRRFQLKMEG